MRTVFGAIGRALAAVVMLVTVWCEQLCRFVIRCLPGYQPATTADLVEAYTEAAVDQPVEPSIDQKIAGLQAAAECLLRQQQPAPDMLEGLSPRTLAWLELLDADMLLAVARARPEELREHLALRQQIRGVLRCEDDTIADYRRAVEADQRVPKNPATRQKRDEAFRMPAFGPIC